MITSARQVWDNTNLYGNCLTQLPSKLWSYTTRSYTTSPRPSILEDPRLQSNSAALQAVVKECIEGMRLHDNFIFREHATCTFHDNGAIKAYGVRSLEFVLPKNLLILIGKIAGLCLTMIALVLAPIGFAAKIVHNAIKPSEQFPRSSEVARAPVLEPLIDID